MRHKHGVRGGNANATASIRDAYGFEVHKKVFLSMLLIMPTRIFNPPPSAVSVAVSQVKKEMLSLYQKYAPLWEKEELERSERWDAFLARFETIYHKVKPEQ